MHHALSRVRAQVAARLHKLRRDAVYRSTEALLALRERALRHLTCGGGGLEP